MARSISVDIEGLDAVKKLFRDVQSELTGKELGYFIKDQARVVAQEARRQSPFKGQINKMFKKDIGTGRVKGAPDQPFVEAGSMFRETIGREKVAVIASHMTEGFNQTNRTGKKIGSSRLKNRGVVKDQLPNPVLKALTTADDKRQAASDKWITRKLNKIKAKNRNVLI